MAKNTKISTVFFGLDGVIVDTERYYDKFWNKIAQDSGLRIDNFASVIKGMTINSIIELYFTICSLQEKRDIRSACSQMELSIDYKTIMIPGILDFVKFVKENGYKTGIVTSSPSQKVDVVLEQLSLKNTFDTIITSDSIKKGKPDPMGYVLAQTNLGSESSECVVFEDSFTGIKAATYAFMRVIGVTTTLSAEFLKDYVFATIPDFKDIDHLKSLMK